MHVDYAFCAYTARLPRPVNMCFCVYMRIQNLNLNLITRAPISPVLSFLDYSLCLISAGKRLSKILSLFIAVGTI